MRKQRFVREAKAASPLNHPNIVTIHGISYDDVDFIVMEYVDRRTLDKLIGAKGLRLVAGSSVCRPNCRRAHWGAGSSASCIAM